MTKNEARAIFQAHADWVNGKSIDTSFFGSANEAREVLCEPPTIAQTIRDAAVNWPQPLGDVEHILIEAFQPFEGCSCYLSLHSPMEDDRIQARTFMLLVAEALE